MVMVRQWEDLSCMGSDNTRSLLVVFDFRQSTFPIRQANYNLLQVSTTPKLLNQSDHGVLGFWGFGVLGLGFRV